MEGDRERENRRSRQAMPGLVLLFALEGKEEQNFLFFSFFCPATITIARCTKVFFLLSCLPIFSWNWSNAMNLIIWKKKMRKRKRRWRDSTSVFSLNRNGETEKRWYTAIVWSEYRDSSKSFLVFFALRWPSTWLNRQIDCKEEEKGMTHQLFSPLLTRSTRSRQTWALLARATTRTSVHSVGGEYFPEDQPGFPVRDDQMLSPSKRVQEQHLYKTENNQIIPWWRKDPRNTDRTSTASLSGARGERERSKTNKSAFLFKRDLRKSSWANRRSSAGLFLLD